MIKIAGVKSNDKINFKEFVDFFYKVDWETSVLVKPLVKLLSKVRKIKHQTPMRQLVVPWPVSWMRA